MIKDIVPVILITFIDVAFLIYLWFKIKIYNKINNIFLSSILFLIIISFAIISDIKISSTIISDLKNI